MAEAADAVPAAIPAESRDRRGIRDAKAADQTATERYLCVLIANTGWSLFQLPNRVAGITVHGAVWGNTRTTVADRLPEIDV